MKMLRLTRTSGVTVYVNADAIVTIEPYTDGARIDMSNDAVNCVIEDPETVALMCSDITFAAMKGEEE